MTTRHLVAALILTLSAVAAAPGHPSAQAVERTVYVTVLDKSGAPVTGVGPSDVVVREDGITREVLRVEPATEPMQLALMVDDSQQAEPIVGQYRLALPAFITTIAEDPQVQGRHQISLITLGARPTVVVDGTSDTARLTAAAQRIFAQSGSGTYLLDGIYEIGGGFERGRASRPVMVAVVTEGPEYSNRFYQQVLDVLHESGAAFHIVIVGRPMNNELDRAAVISLGPADSGGSYRNLLTQSALTSQLTRLAKELTSQHRVIYARPDTLIPPERTTVSSARADWTVRGTAARTEGGRGR